MYWLKARGGSQAGDMYAIISAYPTFLSSLPLPLPLPLFGPRFQVYFCSLPLFFTKQSSFSVLPGFELGTQKSAVANANHFAITASYYTWLKHKLYLITPF